MRVSKRHSRASPCSPAVRRSRTPRRSPTQTSTRSKALARKHLLLSSAGPNEEARVLMLETVREYARELLDGANDEAEMRARHCRRYLDLATQSERHVFRRSEPEWLSRLETEIDNIRAALDWPLDGNRNSRCASPACWGSTGRPHAVRTRASVGCARRSRPPAPRPRSAIARGVGSSLLLCWASRTVGTTPKPPERTGSR